MKKAVSYVAAVMLVCGLVAAGLVAGCDAVARNQDIEITLSADTISGPSSVSCVASLTATTTDTNGLLTGLFLPLEWWVENPALGYIASSEGYRAVYVSADSEEDGVNIINVRDQRGNSGTIGIDHVEIEHVE